MHHRLGLALALTSLPALALVAACTHDFDTFVVDGDASPEAGGEGGTSRTDGGACSAAPTGCLEEAGACVIDCDKTRDRCNSKCNNNGCKQQCANASQQCRSTCADTCTKCSTSAGCQGASDCTAATR